MAITDPAEEQQESTRKPLGWLARAIIAYLLLELGAIAGLQILESTLGVQFAPVSTTELPAETREKLESLIDGELTYLRHDPALGWAIRESGSTQRHRANSQGIRADRDYNLRAAPGIVRIATFGDSFTHGDDVDNKSTWQAQLEPTLSSVEVLNFGVPKYGVDQAYLRYMEHGSGFRPGVVLIGVTAENVYRGLNVWRPYYKTSFRFPLTKPRFKMQAGRLVLAPNPLANLKACEEFRDDPAAILPGIADNDSLFDMQYAACGFDLFPSVRLGKMLNWKRTLADLSPLDERGQYKLDHEGFKVLTGTLSAVVEAARANHANVMVLVLPDDVLPMGSDELRPYQPLTDWLSKSGIEFLDLQDAFDRYREDLSKEELSVGNPEHYSPAANGIVAEALRNKLTELGWALP